MVSTIITVYNRPVLVREAVASVLAQTYRPIEIVLVDDGSTDDTPAVCDRLAAAHPDVIQVVHQANAGPAAATNVALGMITGQFVQFLDSDDVLHPGKFAAQVADLRARGEYGISYCLTREYDMGRRWSGLPARRTAYKNDPLLPTLLEGRAWPTVSALYRREVVDANGPFLDLRVYQDWEYECRAAARGVRALQCPQYLADMRCVHAAEGRTKAGVDRALLPQMARAVDAILGHALSGGVTGRPLRRFAGRLVSAACRLAAAGFIDDAKALLVRAETAGGAWTRMLVCAVRVTATVTGWPSAGRLAGRILYGRSAARIRALRAWPRTLRARWTHRLLAGRQIISGRPVRQWPVRLWHGWTQRRSRVTA